MGTTFQPLVLQGSSGCLRLPGASAVRPSAPPVAQPKSYFTEILAGAYLTNRARPCVRLTNFALCQSPMRRRVHGAETQRAGRGRGSIH